METWVLGRHKKDLEFRVTLHEQHSEKKFNFNVVESKKIADRL